MENDWPAIIKLQVHQTGAPGFKQHVLKSIRINFGSSFSGNIRLVAAAAAAGATAAAAAVSALTRNIFGCHISKSDRSQNHIPYRQLPTLVIFRLFHFVLFCVSRLHPCEKCTASEPAGTRPEPVVNVPGAKAPARIVKSALPRNPLEPVRNPW